MFFIIIKDMFSYAGLAEVDMTKVTVALCYSSLTKVTPGHVLGHCNQGPFLRSNCKKKSIDNSLWALIIWEVLKYENKFSLAYD